MKLFSIADTKVLGLNKMINVWKTNRGIIKILGYLFTVVVLKLGVATLFRVARFILRVSKFYKVPKSTSTFLINSNWKDFFAVLCQFLVGNILIGSWYKKVQMYSIFIIVFCKLLYGFYTRSSTQIIGMEIELMVSMKNLSNKIN